MFCYMAGWVDDYSGLFFSIVAGVSPYSNNRIQWSKLSKKRLIMKMMVTNWDLYKPTKQDCLRRQHACVPAQVQQDKWTLWWSKTANFYTVSPKISKCEYLNIKLVPRYGLNIDAGNSGCTWKICQSWYRKVIWFKQTTV